MATATVDTTAVQQKATDYKVADISLADFGRKEIDKSWIEALKILLDDFIARATGEAPA